MGIIANKLSVYETSSTEKEDKTPLPTQEAPTETSEINISDKQDMVNTISTVSNSVLEETKLESVPEKISETASNKIEDLPPPLPVSPPPSEPLEVKMETDLQELSQTSSTVETVSVNVEKVASFGSFTIKEKIETTSDMIKDAERMAMETGQKIEEKATDLLKTVEERAEESMRTADEFISQTTQKFGEVVDNALGQVQTVDEDVKKDLSEIDEAASKLEETTPELPVDISNLRTASSKPEESSEKNEESGAGESLADIPKDLAAEVAAATIEATTPDSLNISVTAPAPVVETATAE